MTGVVAAITLLAACIGCVAGAGGVLHLWDDHTSVQQQKKLLARTFEEAGYNVECDGTISPACARQASQHVGLLIAWSRGVLDLAGQRILARDGAPHERLDLGWEGNGTQSAAAVEALSSSDTYVRATIVTNPVGSDPDAIGAGFGPPQKIATCDINGWSVAVRTELSSLLWGQRLRTEAQAEWSHGEVRYGVVAYSFERYSPVAVVCALLGSIAYG